MNSPYLVLRRPRAARCGRTAPIALAVVLALLALVVGVFFLASRQAPRSGPELEPGARPAVERVAGESLAPTPLEVHPPVAPRESANEPAAPAASAPSPGTLTLMGRFVLPDRKGVSVDEARVTLSAQEVGAEDAGTVHEARVHGATRVLLSGLHPASYRLRVEAAGFGHHEQELDLTPLQHSAAEHEEDIVLWPEGWIAVRIETRDGRPFGELARELDIQPVQLFTATLGLRARLEPPPAGVPDAPGDEGLATFQRVPGHRRWVLGDGSAGSLRLHARAPMWLGLLLNGVPLDWQLLRPGDERVTFRVGLEQVESTLATVRLRVVSAGDELPVGDARVTLRASHSALRREELHDRAVRADGRLELRRLVPGSYELAVAREGALLADALELLPGETRELGDLALPLGPGLEVEVAHAAGADLFPWLQLGPYRRGEVADELYPSLLSRHVPTGRPTPIPAPAAPTILRARASLGDPRQHPPTLLSASVLLDPDDLPVGPILLTVHEPVAVVFILPAGSPTEGARIDVLDDLDLIVASAPLEGPRPGRVHLIPGTYRALLREANGATRDEIRFELEDQALDVHWP